MKIRTSVDEGKSFKSFQNTRLSTTCSNTYIVLVAIAELHKKFEFEEIVEINATKTLLERKAINFLNQRICLHQNYCN